MRASRFENWSLGLARSDLRLADYSPAWKRAYSAEAHTIYDTLRIEGLRLYHVGSTSVPGLKAKPVLDILGSVESLTELDDRRALFEGLGYEYKGEYGIPGRRYSVLYDHTKTIAFAHLHFFAHHDAQVASHLAFRDGLRSDPQLRSAYETEKIRLVEIENVSRAEYSPAKTSIISRQLALPKRNLGKVLAILGSAKGGGHTETFLREKYPDAELVRLADGGVKPYEYGAHAPDEFESLVERMVTAERVVLATPVYWYAMSGAMKVFFDRFSDLLRGPLKPWGERMAGVKLELLSTGSDERLPLGFETPFISTAIYLGMDYMGARYRQYP